MKLYPVVHMKSPSHAIELSQQALEADADGVFLIDHLSLWSPEALTRAYAAVRTALGERAWIGVNYLSLQPKKACAHLQLAKLQGTLVSYPMRSGPMTSCLFLTRHQWPN